MLDMIWPRGGRAGADIAKLGRSAMKGFGKIE